MTIEKIASGITLLDLFKDVVFSRPRSIATLAFIVIDLTKQGDDIDKAASQTIIELLELILKLKREHPEIYEDIFKILDELLEICEENKELIHEKLKDFD